MKSNYGESKRYIKEEGAEYFRYQNQYAALGAILNKEKFAGLVRPADRVLDFGCGGGWLLKELECAERIGVEVNEMAHPVCANNGIKVYTNVADVLERDFDVIISHHCLEHVPYPIEALRALSRLLSEGGKIVLVLPLDDWRTQRDFAGRDINHHLHTWTPRLLANCLIEANLSVVSIEILTHAWFPGWHKLLGRIPPSVFNIGCVIWSFLRKRRQLLAVARKAAS